MDTFAPVPKQREGKSVGAWLGLDVYNAVVSLAQENGLSIGDLLRQMIRHCLAEMKEGQD